MLISAGFVHSSVAVVIDGFFPPAIKAVAEPPAPCESPWLVAKSATSVQDVPFQYSATAT